MKRKPNKILSFLLPLAAMATVAKGAESIVPVAGTYTYTQNFNTMFVPATAGAVGTTAATAWADGVTVPNWWFHYASNVVANTGGVFAGAAFAHSGNDGSAAPTLTLNSAGVAGDTNRFFATPSTTGRSEQSGIVIFQNNSASAVALSRVKFNGRVLRTNSGANNVESVLVSYRKGASQAALLTMAQTNLTAALAAARYPATLETTPTVGYYVDGWSLIPSAHFTYTNANAATPVDETIPIDATGLSGITVPPGEFVGVRFANVNGAGTDALMGVDDVELTFTEVSAFVNASASGVVRTPGVDPTNPQDDKINFTLNVTGTGTVGLGWDVTTPAAFAASGTYNTPRNYTDLDIALFDNPTYSLTGTATDNGGSGASGAFTVTVPWTTFAVTGNSFVHMPGIDAGNPSDDTFTFNLNVTGQYVSSTWATPVAAPAGTPANGPYGVNQASGEVAIPVGAGAAAPIAQQGPFTVSDSIVTSAVSGNLYLLPPMIIGKSTVLGVGDIISDGKLIAGDANQVTWSTDPTIPMIQMTDGDAGNAGAAAKPISATINLAGVAGPVRLSMQMVATDGSSGFEAADTFTAQLVYNDGVSDLPPVNLVTAAHETQNGFTGVINGILADDEIVGANTTATFNFQATIPDNIVSARLEIAAITDSGYASERLVVQGITLDPAPPGIEASGASNITRVENGPGADDDTVTFTATITGINGGPSWTATGATPASGAFGTHTFTIAAPLPASPATVTVTDSTIPASADISVAIPGRGILGQMNFGAGLSNVATTIAPAASALWVNDAALRTFTITAGVNAQTETIHSEVLDLSAVGDVSFTAALDANDTSAGSNFDLPDKFKAELIIDGGLGTESIVNLVTPYDVGDGLSAVPFVAGAAVPNGAPDGWINGYTGTASVADGFAAAVDEYDAHKVRDEFNTAGTPGADPSNGVLTFSHTIPASATTVQLRVTSEGIQGTETAILKNILWQTLSVPMDSDSDGMDDAYEIANGLDPNVNDAALDKDGDGRGNLAEFLAGTNPSDAASALRVLDIIPTGPGVVSVTLATVPGKKYQLQESTDLGAGDTWADLPGALVTASGAVTTVPNVPVPVPGNPSHFVRAKVVP